jgi:4-hydroxythreonine-4-phosphate dehydrogenase
MTGATGGCLVPVLAITSGEPAGVGPELCASVAAKVGRVRSVVLGDRNLLVQRARLAGIDVAFAEYDPAQAPPPGCVEVLHLPLAVPSEPGRLDPANARHVLGLLDRAVAGCLAGEFAGMVTAPVHKGIINDAGVPFSGHTEYLAEKTATPRVVMMLVGGGLRVALATTHLALKNVPSAITVSELQRTLRILDHDLKCHFGLAAPTILVAGLNPHAGEGGHMGREEIEVIVPALEALRREGISLIGPLPADTLFTPRVLKQGDAVLAMYHDQGLATLKYASFGEGVNVTLGLPIIRTSVDHGTALDLAGSGKADPGSLHTAIDLACQMANVRAGVEPATRTAAG